MKKLLLLSATALVAFSCGQKNKAHISGTFSGISKDTIYLEMLTTKGRTVVDSTVTNQQGNYRFTVSTPVAAPTFYNIVYKQSSIPVIVSPGEKVKVNSLCDLGRNYTVEGSDDSKLLKEFNTMYSNGVRSLDSLANLYSETRPTPDNDARRTALLREYTQRYVKIKREHIAFIVKNASSMAAVYALYQRLPNDEALFNANDDRVYYRMVADSLADKYPASPHVIALLRDVKTQDDAAALAQQVSRQQAETAGLNHPEITLQDMFGKDHKLSELKNKAILLTFWSVTDPKGPAMNNEMKELYKEFSGKGFDIYQVSLDSDKASWILAVQAQKLPWTNVIDPNGFTGLPAMSYNVAATPPIRRTGSGCWYNGSTRYRKMPTRSSWSATFSISGTNTATWYPKVSRGCWASSRS